MRLEAVLQQHEPVGDGRTTDRRSLRLAVRSHSPAAGERRVVVHNISRTGLLIEAPERTLGTGDVLFLDVPEDGTIESQVVWESGRFVGCKFRTPISQAAMSGALLQAEPAATGGEPQEPLDTSLHAGREGLAPEVSFLPALLIAVLLWAMILAGAYLVFR